VERRRRSTTYRAAFLIAPVRMQRVQTFIRFTDEPTITRTRCRFGIQRRLDTLWAWLTRFPNTGAFPQTSHIFAMLTPSNNAKGVDCNQRADAAQPAGALQPAQMCVIVPLI
jgi:hypothetical protein